MKFKNFSDITLNMFFKKTGIYSFLKPKVLTIVFTNKCNSRCLMCKIWEKKQHMNELTLDDYKKIFLESKLLKNVSILNLTGGEIFLRDDLPEFVKFLVENLKDLEEIRFASNGFMPDRIERYMNDIVKLPCRFNIKISIDGLEETHNNIRGIKNGFSLAEDTIERLRKIREKHENLDVAIAHTIMPQNFRETLDVYNRYNEKNLDFICKVVYHAIAFENMGVNIDFTKEQKKTVISNLEDIYKKEVLKLKKSPKNFQRLKRISYLLFLRYHIKNLADPKKFLVPCHSTFSSITIESDGKVYSCGIIYKLLGELKRENFDSIWKKEENRGIRDFINKGKCKCSNACDTLPSLIIANIPEVLKKFAI